LVAQQRDLLRERGLRQPGSCLAFLVRTQIADPSEFELPDTPADKAGVFYFAGGNLPSSL